jgi:hypothetical protein
MKTLFSPLPSFDPPRVALWRQSNCVVRKHLPLRVVLQVLLFGEVYFGRW